MDSTIGGSLLGKTTTTGEIDSETRTSELGRRPGEVDSLIGNNALNNERLPTVSSQSDNYDLGLEDSNLLSDIEWMRKLKEMTDANKMAAYKNFEAECHEYGYSCHFKVPINSIPCGSL